MIPKKLYNAICVLLIYIIICYNNNVSAHWMLKTSYEAKPIYFIKDEVAKWPTVISANCRAQLDVMLNQRPLESEWAANSKLPFP